MSSAGANRRARTTVAERRSPCPISRLDLATRPRSSAGEHELGVELLTVAGCDDIGLNRVFRRIRRITGDDASLIKSAGALVGATIWFTAVTPADKHDRSLLFHRAPATREGALVISAQTAGGGVAASEREF